MNKHPLTRLMTAIWVYLNQPLFQPTTTLNPFKFSPDYKKQHLERCYAKQYEAEKQRLFLECCWYRSCEIS
jgi:hypothetical protein